MIITSPWSQIIGVATIVFWVVLIWFFAWYMPERDAKKRLATKFCAGCGAKMVFGYVITKKGYNTEHGYQIEKRYYGRICSVIDKQYFDTFAYSHTGYDWVLQGPNGWYRS